MSSFPSSTAPGRHTCLANPAQLEQHKLTHHRGIQGESGTGVPFSFIADDGLRSVRSGVCPTPCMLKDTPAFFVQPPRGSSSSAKRHKMRPLRGRCLKSMVMLVLTVECVELRAL